MAFIRCAKAAAVVVAVGVCLGASPAQAAIPAKLQAVLIAKILKYDRTLSDREPAATRIVIVAQAEGNAGKVKSFLSSLGFDAAVVQKVAEVDNNANAVYLLDGKPQAVAKLAASNQLLSLTNNVNAVEAGSISVGLRLKSNGRPEIVVNLKRLKKEGHEFASGLLRVARVLR